MATRTPKLALLLILTACLMVLVGLLLSGCEFYGQYSDDGVKVQYGNTNSATQASAQ